MSSSRPKAWSCSSLLLIVAKRQVSLVVEFGVRPLFDTVAEDHHAAAGCDLQIQFDMPVTEDIIVAVVVLFLLVLGEENKFFFIFSFVRAGVRDVLQSAPFRPGVAEFVSPRRR